jgi:hypothetical protein
MGVIQKERQTTNFSHANDRLSRAASDLFNGMAALYEGYQYDSLVDGGEFCGTAYEKMTAELYKTVATKYHYASVAAMGSAMKKVCSPRQVYMMFRL